MIRILIFSLVVAFMVGCGERTVLKSGSKSSSWQVTYDAQLSDRLFDTEEYSWPWYIIEHPDGRLENVTGEDSEVVAKYRHTARVSSKYIMPHTIDTAYAWIAPNGDLLIAIYFEKVELNDHLLISLRGSAFAAAYWTYPLVTGAQAVWEILDANLVLQHPGAHVDDPLNAFVDVRIKGVFEDGSIVANRINGYIKPIIMNQVPPEFKNSETLNKMQYLRE